MTEVVIECVVSGSTSTKVAKKMC